jgi:dynein heavy chain 1
VYVHKTVKEGLDVKMNEMNDFPNMMRSYQVYQTYLTHIKNYKKVNDVLQDLRNDAMKPKHWKELLSKLKIRAK